AAAQSRADQVAQHFGKRAPAPMVGESVQTYRGRLLLGFQSYSKDAAKLDIHTINVPVAFGIIEDKIYADAIAAAKDMSDFIVEGTILPMTEVTPEGHRITRYHGGRSFVHNIKPPAQYVRKFYTERHN
ncbi:hypothetical protein, partial [Acidisphaera rubrifaciens]|uniref:hypothetical protein n=1 Tax=Acidisphaera rubrifaciens TaxID=50715 RepID=UPI0006628903